MEFEGNNMMLCSSSKEQNGNNTSSNNNNNSGNFGWDLWEESSSSNSTLPLGNAVMFLPDGGHVQVDPYLTCLKLGKRDYFDNGGGGKRVRGGVTTTVARCQVEGCHVALVNAKEYHRRHKVCEMHSKAPKVVVLGLDQRFCQQCSRFHVVSEFDDSKRSCRRRLAGHNERRRKSFHHSLARSSSQENKLMVGGFPYLSTSSSSSSLLSSLPPPPLSSECALSLLSSSKDDHSCFSPSDLSTRCSAALRELIAENRAAVMAKQIILDREPHHGMEEEDDLKEIQTQSNYNFPQHHQMFP